MGGCRCGLSTGAAIVSPLDRPHGLAARSQKGPLPESRRDAYERGDLLKKGGCIIAV